MSLYTDYLTEIDARKEEGLHPKPVDGADLLAEIIGHIEDPGSEHRADCLDFFVYNVLPGTTSAAGLKAQFLKDIILGSTTVAAMATIPSMRLRSGSTRSDRL